MEVTLYDLVAVVITFVITLIGTSSYYRKFKKTLKEGADVVSSVNTLIHDIREALEDDQLTKEEVKKIIDDSQNVIREFEEFVETIRKLVKK